MYSKKTYVSPKVDVIVTESAPLMSGSLNSYDGKDEKETIDGQDALSNGHSSIWENDDEE